MMRNIDYEREHLRRELQESLNAIDKATISEGDEQLKADALAVARLLLVGDGLRAYSESVIEQIPGGPEAAAEIKKKL
jgi:hypothetical protein